MARPAPEDVRRIACVGGGTIGAGWAALFLAHGKEVVLADPAPDAGERARAVIDRAWPHLEALGLKPGADRARLSVAGSIAEAVADADLVQESVLEDEDLKIEVFAEMDAHARPDTVLSSSSSAFLPTNLQSRCKHPERVVIGHPFAPVYLLPLLEVVAGEKTSQDAVDWSTAFYESIDRRVVVLKKEILGYVGNRLQGAISREAMELVEAGICTWDDIDVSVTEGPGLRWAFMGPNATTHLAGGRGGFRHSVELWGWGGSDESLEAALAAIADRFGDAPMAELETWRDEILVKLLKSRRDPPKA